MTTSPPTTPTVSADADANPNVAAHQSAVQLLSNDEYSKYLLQNKNEMIPVLRGLVEAVSQVTMFFNEGRDMVLTSLVSYDDTSIVLDFGPSSEMNRKALEAEKLFCVTQLEKVKIQFVLRGLRRTEADGRPAFKANFPDSLLRLQRREYFRLTLPVTRPLKCNVSWVTADGLKKSMEASAADISGGGMGLSGMPIDTPLEVGTELTIGRMELPEVGLVTGKIRVCSLAEVTNRMGLKTKRAGCEFVGLPGPMQTLIQRYIIKVERERKARESGL